MSSLTSCYKSDVGVNVFSITSRRQVAASDTTMSLVELCKEGDLEGVKAALQSGADVNSKDEKGITGLMWAVVTKNNEVLKMLLSVPNLNVNSVAYGGLSALHAAVGRETNDIEALKLLLNVPNINVNIVDSEGESVVHWAVKYEHIEELKLLLDVPNIDLNIVDIKGESGVYRAVKENKIEALKLLLSQPSFTALTLNKKSREGVAPVMLAVRPDRYESLLLLLADPRVDLDTDFEGQSLEEIARWLFLLNSSERGDGGQIICSPNR